MNPFVDPSPADAPVVTLVGAGPGDPELLTLKAVRAIRQATVLLVDDLVGPQVLRYARRSARIVPVGKRGGCRSTPQAFIERLMIAEARRGERVVRLKGGGPVYLRARGRRSRALACRRFAGRGHQRHHGRSGGLHQSRGPADPSGPRARCDIRYRARGRWAW